MGEGETAGGVWPSRVFPSSSFVCPLLRKSLHVYFLKSSKAPAFSSSWASGSVNWYELLVSVQREAKKSVRVGARGSHSWTSLKKWLCLRGSQTLKCHQETGQEKGFSLRKCFWISAVIIPWEACMALKKKKKRPELPLPTWPPSVYTFCINT